MRVAGCRIRDTSKSSLYLASCERAVVSGNVVTEFGGHRLAGGIVVGAAIQLSSSREVVCSDNVLGPGVGIGILCNALTGGEGPQGCS